MRNIEIIEVSAPPARKNIGRAIGTIIGLAIAIIGIIMALSIVLIIPGIMAVATGTIIAVLSAPKASVICPACSTENRVTLKSKSMKCEGCATITPLKWPKGSGNKWTSWDAWKREKDSAE